MLGALRCCALLTSAGEGPAHPRDPRMIKSCGPFVLRHNLHGPEIVIIRGASRGDARPPALVGPASLPSAGIPGRSSAGPRTGQAAVCRDAPYPTGTVGPCHSLCGGAASRSDDQDLRPFRVVTHPQEAWNVDQQDGQHLPVARIPADRNLPAPTAANQATAVASHQPSARTWDPPRLPLLTLHQSPRGSRRQCWRPGSRRREPGPQPRGWVGHHAVKFLSARITRPKPPRSPHCG